MNERIKELAKHANLKLDELSDDTFIPLEKFAELIVQECLNICEEMGDNGKDGHYCADKIAKTFYYKNVLAGAEVVDDFGGYEESTLEKQQEFANKRNFKYE